MERVAPEMTKMARQLRAESTSAERKLWDNLRTLRPRFTRQLVVDRYILDFACRSVKLAIEVDGGQHASRLAEDAARTAYLASEGWTVLRFWNNDILMNIEGAMDTIIATVAQASTHPQPLPSREGSLGLTHLDPSGAARMVDVSAKSATVREATAAGRIAMSPQAAEAIRAGAVKKGDVLAVARVAGIMAAKRTADLIPLCHPLPISGVTLDLTVEADGITASATVRTTHSTGVEMEAMTAVSVALLTIYDMAKALDRGMVIGDVKLLAKSGGRSGDWTAA